MQATLTLNQKELEQAAREYIERAGWKCSEVKIEIKRGYDGDPREPGTPDTCSVTARVDGAGNRAPQP